MKSHTYFSVIVPTYDRPRHLEECLKALASLDYPCSRFEVIVVDDDSGPATEKVAISFHDQLDLKFVTQTHAGPARARNTGASLARGEMLAFTDDDCRPSTGWLQALHSNAMANPGQMIGGSVFNALHDNAYATASHILVDLVLRHCNAGLQGPTFLPSNNLAIPTGKFWETGGFDAAFNAPAGEDRDFCDRWLGQGFRMRYALDAVVFHAHDLNLRAFWRQQFNYGRGSYNYHRLRRCRRQGSFTPDLRLYLSILSYPLSAGVGTLQHRYALAALLFLSQIGVGSGFFLESFRRAAGSSTPG